MVRPSARASDQRAANDSVPGRGLAHPSARSLLFTLLGEYVLPRHEPTWSSALVAGLAAVGVEEKTARQAIARTSSAGWLKSQRVGRQVAWDLTPAARELLEHGAERIYSFTAARSGWDGLWLLLRVNVPEERRELRSKLKTQLAWAGFGSLRPGLWLSPDVRRESEAGHIVDNLGLRGLATSFVVRLGAIGEESAMVDEAWDLEELAAAYAEFIGQFGSIKVRSGAKAFEVCTRLVHEWRLFPFMDPGLPERLLPSGWVGHKAADLFRSRRAQLRTQATEWFHSQADPPRGARLRADGQ